jgi:hypothetical protein
MHRVTTLSNGALYMFSFVSYVANLLIMPDSNFDELAQQAFAFFVDCSPIHVWPNLGMKVLCGSPELLSPCRYLDS